uniref:Uncharacterized protein n=1 Tax=Nelumbo nucifera TaxID=4432 RepID=A0A822Y1W3_NELNU|nr:TPA_asm: hypothetical protein HUJ06_026753 [Nelumbo nucifera]
MDMARILVKVEQTSDVPKQMNLLFAGEWYVLRLFVEGTDGIYCRTDKEKGAKVNAIEKSREEPEKKKSKR